MSHVSIQRDGLMIDGPYVFERDIVGRLKGGKGTFFLNVRASSIYSYL